MGGVQEVSLQKTSLMVADLVVGGTSHVMWLVLFGEESL